MPLKIVVCSIVIVSLGFSGTGWSETSQEKGYAIAKEAKRRDLGWKDSEVTLKMVLKNSQRESSNRELRTLTYEIEAEGLGDKSLTIFDRPRDIEGTAFLSHTKIREPDDQWLYLPALKRVKRISSANKSGPFVGSEFAYEDLLSFEIGRYTYSWLRDEKCGSLDCFVVEYIPVYENSGYTREEVWIDKVEYRPMKINFYDRKNSLLKTLIYSEYQQYLGQYWRAHRFQMDNHQTGKSTTLTFGTYKFRVGHSERFFTPSRLKRVR
ncbi:MAG: outer membrane lipoprotein-sorting protein [Nitrospirota bacterium]|nr:outer membrane lipoprotein-sorting protein [Nitrospirota bacterium]